MGILPFLSLAGAMRIQARAFVDEHPAAWRKPRARARQELVTVAVAARDALLVRRAVIACPGAAVASCLPMHREDRVRLEIRFPAGCADALIHQVLAAVPSGEIGAVLRCAAR